MYQTTIKGDKRFHSLSEGYGAPVELFGYTEDGETPMSLVNIAFGFLCDHVSTELFCQVSGESRSLLFRLIPTMKKGISPWPFIYLRI